MKKTSLVCSDNGSWQSDYGVFFLEWYSQNLLEHANRVLEAAHDVFGCEDIKMFGKVPAIHWWHHTASHAVRSLTNSASVFKIK